MPYSVRILADSVNPVGIRLTTFELTYPRFVHSEFMTHRMFSRNSASSRAIPIAKMISRVREDPVIPVYWGMNQKGMQARQELGQMERAQAVAEWLGARDSAVSWAEKMLEIGVHKQLVNRLLEPWMWMTVICSSTDYGHFFNLRCSPEAQPEIKDLADMMADIYYSAKPDEVDEGCVHTPLIYEEDWQTYYTRPDIQMLDMLLASAGRCARVSYLTHDGRRDLQEDIDLAKRLITNGHWSPLEHVARARSDANQSGNFVGWTQLRKCYAEEFNPEFIWKEGK